MGDVLRVPVCRGYLAKLCNGVISDSLSDAYEEITAAIPRQETLGSDESSLKNNGKKHWIWCVTAATFTVFHIAASRGRKVIEELIGDFDDESDQRLGECERLADGSFRINGTLRHDEFEECTGTTLPEGDWQTVAGYVIAALDEIPAVGDRVETEIGQFEVLTMDAYAIDSLRVRLSAPVE